MKLTTLSSKRIPTVLALILLVVGLVGGVVLVSKSQLLNIKAGPSAVPKNIKVANLGSTGFVVTWITDTPVIGLVKYSDNPAKLSLPAGDIRDQKSGNTTAYTTHYVEIVSLKPSTTYYFEIGSGSKAYNDNGKPYQLKTWAQNSAVSEDMITGKVLLSSGQGAGGIILYVEMDKTDTLAAMSKDDGSWRLPLSNIRDKQGQFVRYDPGTAAITIFAQGANTGTATAITNTKNDNPVPDITLGKTQNFGVGDIGSNQNSSVGSDNVSGFSNLPIATEKNLDLTAAPEATLSVKLTNPARNGEKIATQTPEFRGTAPVGTILKITVKSNDEQSTSITVNSSGKWSYSPSRSLSIGDHDITIEYTDDNRIIQKIVRRFTIIAADNLPAFSSTPSATLTPTPTPTPEITTEATSSSLMEVGELTPTYILLILGTGLFFTGIIWKKKINKLIKRLEGK